MPRIVLGELKRRNVIRVAGAYAVTAWALFQIANSLFPALLLPQWSVTLIAVLLLIGFPVTLIIAWAFERTPEGIKRTAQAESVPAVAFGRLDWLLVGATLAIVAITTVQFATRDRVGAGAAAESTAMAPVSDKSVAVLPFVNFGAAAEGEFFADGLTEEVINGLAQLPDLKVAGRTSAFSFKGKNEDLRTIGRKLGVAHVLEGSIRQSGAMLRITAQLIKVDDGYHVWSQTYDRPIGDTFAVQSEISNAVAKVLEARLLGANAAPARRNAEAVALELAAKARLRTLQLEDATIARTMYRKLTSLEPRNPEAFAGFALATMHLVQDHLALDFKTASDESLAAIATALRLNPNSPSALRAKGFAHRVLAIRTGNPQHNRIALAALQQAARTAPRDPDVLALLAAQLQSAGRGADALPYLYRAIEIDPLNKAAQSMLGITFEALGRYAEAEAQYKKTASLFPDFPAAQLALATMRISQGRLDQAVPPLLASRRIGNDIASGLFLAHVYANLGMQREFAAALDALPKSPISNGLARVIRLLHARDYRGLIRLGEQLYSKSPDPIWADVISTGALFAGDAERARRVMAEGTPGLFLPEPEGDATPHEIMLVGTALDAVGDKAQARRLFRMVLASTKPPVSAPEGSAVVARVNAHVGLGDVPEALRELEQAIDAGYRTPIELETFIHLRDYPLMRGLRSQPQFVKLIDRIDRYNSRMRKQLTAQ